jgi:hypothetical protein
MAGARVVEREWTEDLLAGEVRLRCVYKRRGRQVLRFTVQVEVRAGEDWRPIVRYDNAHGFSHRDTIHADGAQEKTQVFVGDMNATFTYASDDLKANWPAHYARYRKETNP